MKSDCVSGRVILVTGAARSGKSEWAETLAKKSNKLVTYVATAIMTPDDPEWQEKILKHQIRRPDNWTTITESKDLATVIKKAPADRCLIIDSLGTWVANLLDVEKENWAQITDDLMSSLAQTDSQLIFVGEETGWGVVPAYASGRLFRDRLGYLNRRIGSVADLTYLVAGGHILNLSALGMPLEG